MRFTRLWLAAAAALSVLGPLLGQRGQPSILVESFPEAKTGIENAPNAITQDGDGRLFFGSDDVVIYNGTTWRRLHVPGMPMVNGIAWDGARSRLWVGSSLGDAIGYFDRDAGGEYAYHDLSDRLEKRWGDIGTIWAIYVDGPRVVYVSARRIFVLENDRVRWTTPLVSDFRIFSNRDTDGAIYACAPGSKLFRVGANRLEPVLDLGFLHGLAVTWSHRTGPGSWLMTSRGGLYAWKNGAASSVPGNASDFIARNRLITVALRPDGTLLLPTLAGGIGVAAMSGELASVIGHGQGVPEGEVNGVFEDRTGGIWISSEGGLLRVRMGGQPATKIGGSLAGHPVVALVADPAGVTASGPAGFYHVAAKDGETAMVAPFNDAPSKGRIAAGPGGLLAPRFRGVDRLGATGSISVWTDETSVRAVASNLADPSRLWVLHASGGMLRLHRSADAYVPEAAVDVSSPWEIEVDRTGQAWVGLGGGGVVVWPLKGGPTIPVFDKAATHGQSVAFAPSSRGIVLAMNGAVYLGRPGTAVVRRVAQLPEGAIGAVAADPDARRIFLAVERNDPQGRIVDCIGVLASAGGQDGSMFWRELDIPSLGALGRVNALAVTGSPQGDILWIGGASGLLKLRVDDAATETPPLPPYFDFARSTALARPTDGAKWTLRYAGNRLRLHFGITDLDHSGRIYFQSRVASENQDWSAPSLAPVAEFSALHEGRYDVEVRTISPSGLTSEPLALSFAVAPPWYRSLWAYLADALLGLLGLAAVITWRQRRIRRSNLELSRQVRERTAQLEKASAAKDEFVASISHEIRNPLNGIIGLSAALEATADESQRHQLELMRHCSQHLASLIEEILDFARIEAGEITVASDRFGVAELLASVRSVMSEASSNARMPVDLLLDPSVPSHLLGDAHKIRQILVNYVGNAIKYAGRGRVTLSVFAIPRPDGRFDVTFGVGDEGPGIPEEEQQQLFSKFKRGSAAQNRNVPGSGLGLAVCRKLAEKMGGTTLLRSEVGKGAFFYLCLPLAEAGGVPDAEVAAFALESPVPALIVEDQEFNSLGLAAQLRELGLQADIVKSGEEALERLGLRDFAIIFVDRDLPGMTGLDFTRELRRRERETGRRAIIVATTGSATRQSVRECSLAGMDGFVGKPVTIPKLRAVLGDLLGARKAAPSVRLAAKTPTTPEGWSVETLRYIAQGDDAEFARRMRSYVRELDGYLSEVETALRRADFEKLRRNSHRLVGHLSIIEHAALIVAAQQIEESAVNRDIAGAGAKLAELLSVIHSVRVRLLADAESALSE